MLVQGLLCLFNNIAQVTLVTRCEVMHTLQVRSHIVLLVSDESGTKTARQFSIFCPGSVTPNQV